MSVLCVCKRTCDVCKKQIDQHEADDDSPGNWGDMVIRLETCDGTDEMSVDICDECLEYLASDPAFKDDLADEDEESARMAHLNACSLVARIQARTRGEKTAKKALKKKGK